MAMSNAERQAAYRARRKAELDALRDGTSTSKPAPSRNDLWESVTLHIDNGNRFPLNIVEMVEAQVLRDAEEVQRDKIAKRKKKVDKAALDVQQQEKWQNLYHAATDELLYVDSFLDQRETVDLHQNVRVVKRTGGRITVVAMHDRKGVTRYKLRQIPPSRLYGNMGRSIIDEPFYIEMNARVHRVKAVLFVDEDAYAERCRLMGDDTWEKCFQDNLKNSNQRERNRRNSQPHVVLGIEPDSTQAEIKAAYRKKAQEHHPDKGGSADEFRKVQTAYEWLRAAS